MLADDNIKLPISVAERITHDTLLYYLELVEFDVERFAKKKKLKPHELEDFTYNKKLVSAIKRVMEYIKPIE